MYRAEKKSLQILLSSTQAGPGRKVKQEQEENSRNHVPRRFLGSVNKWLKWDKRCLYLGIQPALITPKSNDVAAPLLSRRLDIWIIVRLARSQPPSLSVCDLVGLVCNKKCLRSVHASNDRTFMMSTRTELAEDVED